MQATISDARIRHASHRTTYKVMMNTVPEDGTVLNKGFITCHCKDVSLRVKVPKKDLERVFHSFPDLTFCDNDVSDPICDRIRNCKNCTADLKMCKPSASAVGSIDCLHKEIHFSTSRMVMSNSSYGSYDGKQRRSKRQIHGCAFPTTLTTADMFCIKYPSSIKCQELCVFGYTLEEGITRGSECLYSENVWKPAGFQECSPFRDCTLTLVSGGSVDCESGTSLTPPSCKVKCDGYEDKKETNETKYTCSFNIRGWNKKLPHCVVTGSGFVLVPTPRIKKHSIKENSNFKLTYPVSLLKKQQAETEKENTTKFAMENTKEAATQNTNEVGIQNAEEASMDHEKKVGIQNANKASMHHAHKASMHHAHKASMHHAHKSSMHHAHKFGMHNAKRLAMQNPERFAMKNAKKMAMQNPKRLAKHNARRMARQHAKRLAMENARRIAMQNRNSDSIQLPPAFAI